MTSRTDRLVNEKPLSGAQICCTAIQQEDRELLAKWAEEMGAEHSLDLTSDVTHLIVGVTNSEKYQYVAREREDVKVLLPSFLHALRELWMNDSPIDMNKLESEHRCPTFHSLTISLTGFQDPHFRAEIERRVEELGGIYSGDLHKACTHLIAWTATGNKYHHATAWNIKVVSLNWFKECMDRGMQLIETAYHPSIEPGRQGRGAWNRAPIQTVTSGKRPRQETTEPATRKIRRTASARFGSQHVEIWNDIFKPNPDPQPDAQEQANGKLRPTKSMSDMTRPESADNNISMKPKQPANPVSRSSTGQQMLTSRYIAIRGFEGKRRELLVRIIKEHGATLQDSVNDLSHLAEKHKDSCFVLVPHEVEGHQLNLLRQKSTNMMIVTEFWLEWCISFKRFVPPDQYPLGWPFTAGKLVPAKQLTINASGFPQRQLLQISKLVAKVGAEYHETFTPRTRLLICHNANVNKQKIQHAQRWNMLVVSQKWLWQLIKTGNLPPLEPYALLPIKRKVVGSHETTSAKDDTAAKTMPPSKMTVAEAQIISRSKSPTPLCERDVNIGEDKVQPAKKRLFRSFDGHDSPVLPENQYEVVEIPTDQDDDLVIVDSVEHDSVDAAEELTKKHDSEHIRRSHQEIIDDLLAVKAEAAARAAAAERQSPTKPKSRKLIGRAISNLSNASRLSDQPNDTNKPLSRVSSITSNNTDGLGIPLSAMSRIPSNLKKRSGKHTGRPLTGNASVATEKETWEGPPQPHMSASNGMSYEDFHAALMTLSNSQLPLPPEPTPQPAMGYADSEESMALKAKLTEMRRKRLLALQQEQGIESILEREDSEESRQRAALEARKNPDTAEGIIRDDEAIVGRGRRTRGREKALNALLHESNEELANDYF